MEEATKTPRCLHFFHVPVPSAHPRLPYFKAQVVLRRSDTTLIGDKIHFSQSFDTITVSCFAFINLAMDN
jgi:hypothetical protein